MIPFLSLRRSFMPRPFISSASRRAYEDVAVSTVVPRSSIILSCFSVFPGPMGTAIAPSLSHPAWNPIPAVQRP